MFHFHRSVRTCLRNIFIGGLFTTIKTNPHIDSRETCKQMAGKQSISLIYLGASENTAKKLFPIFENNPIETIKSLCEIKKKLSERSDKETLMTNFIEKFKEESKNAKTKEERLELVKSFAENTKELSDEFDKNPPIQNLPKNISNIKISTSIWFNSDIDVIPNENYILSASQIADIKHMPFKKSEDLEQNMNSWISDKIGKHIIQLGSFNTNSPIVIMSALSCDINTSENIQEIENMEKKGQKFFGASIHGSSTFEENGLDIDMRTYDSLNVSSKFIMVLIITKNEKKSYLKKMYNYLSFSKNSPFEWDLDNEACNLLTSFTKTQ